MHEKLKELLGKYEVRNYFVFDMSVPDALAYLEQGFNTFTRQSEYETEPAFYEKAEGVWMDCFNREWMNNDNIQRHLSGGKKVCLVSPELHEREYLPFWQKLAGMAVVSDPRLMICTDYPEEARGFFYGKN